jgi:hypothetical protein
MVCWLKARPEWDVVVQSRRTTFGVNETLATVDIVAYVEGTASWGITYRGKRQPLGFWCDANFAACKETQRSTTGWVVTMYRGAVSWSRKKQATTAASTIDAKYQACGAAAWEGMSLRKGLGELALLLADFLLSGPLTIRCDNKAALSLCKDRKEGQRVKHINVIHHFARDRVANGELSFVYCKSEENVSDCFTQAMLEIVHIEGACMGWLVRITV